MVLSGSAAASCTAARRVSGSFSFALALGSWVTALPGNWVSNNLLLNAFSCFTNLYLYWNILKPQMLLYTLNPLSQLLQIRHLSTFSASALLYKDLLFLHVKAEVPMGHCKVSP